MATVTAHISSGARRRTLVVLLAAGLAATIPATPSHRSASLFVDADDQPAGTALPVDGRPKPEAIEAFFGERSYSPGHSARLIVVRQTGRTSLQVFRAGYGREGAPQGAPITSPTALTGRTATIRIANWSSGLYYVRLTSTRGHFGYAFFVVGPRRLGEHRIAVILPTNTWQAYNFYDEDGDGSPDSWYPNPRISCAHLTRPFVDRGVPPHYMGYDRGFIGWLAKEHKAVDFLTDDDLERVSTGDALAQAYDLIVFSGHEEYVTQHEYDATERYRNLGGNLMFLSANNFFYRVERRGDHVCRSGRWRDLGRPEARLIGIQYVDWYQGRYPNRPYTVTGAARAPRVFRGTGLRNSARFGVYGIEIDARTPDSPRDIQMLARIPNIFGPGKSAEMTYYTTPRGAKVFAAGVINFGGTALWPTVSPLLDNLWTELSRP